MRKSGLSDERIRRAGIKMWCAKNGKHAGHAQAGLKWRDPYRGNMGDCRVIPYLASDGSFSGYVRTKFDSPRSNESSGTGKPRQAKYEAA